jgi:hypothetical protein
LPTDSTIFLEEGVRSYVTFDPYRTFPLIVP